MGSVTEEQGARPVPRPSPTTTNASRTGWLRLIVVGVEARYGVR
jgi:hypothetical protein